MTDLKLKSTTAFNHYLSKGLRGTLVLVAASLLFACSQPDSAGTDASVTSTPNAEVAAASKTAEPNAKNAPMMTSVNHSDLLKNVSATVYKDANCDCCEGWMNHAKSNGLSAAAEHPKDLALLKDHAGVPNQMRSCHTVITTDNYVFEGHVPAKYMAQFLENPPVQALGLAVPGMPVGSPGMEYQNKFEPYQIIQLNKDGTTEVYADINAVQQQL